MNGAVPAETQTLTGYCGRFGKTVWTILGSGGKTSLLWLLADSRRSERTLVTTTTRMMRPLAASGLYDYAVTEAAGISRLPQTGACRGVTLAGTEKIEQGVAKFRSLPLETLEIILPLFDYAYIEGDGSKRLPLKAWAAWEPVVTASTGVTAGMLPLWPLGLPADDRVIHRLPLWTELTGAKAGAPVTMQHLAHAISGAQGLFKAARGYRILFFNQVEDETALRTAQELSDMLPRDFKRSLEGIIAGSVRQNTVTVLR